MNTDEAKVVVLVVDDDPLERLLVREGLESHGFLIEEAADGTKALEVFRTVSPDIVLLDINMPGISGIETCAALRNLPGGAQLPIMMVTGWEDMDSIAHSYAAGASDFMVKSTHSLILGSPDPVFVAGQPTLPRAGKEHGAPDGSPAHRQGRILGLGPSHRRTGDYRTGRPHLRHAIRALSEDPCRSSRTDTRRRPEDWFNSRSTPAPPRSSPSV